MFQWGAMLTMLGAAGGCLLAMGVGAPRLGELIGILLLMMGAAALIAFPFLRRRTPR